MVSLTKTKSDGILFKQVRKQAVIEAAWRHVFARASVSKNRDTRRVAFKLSLSSATLIRRISDELRYRKFKFLPQKGVVKRRPGKKARALVDAPITNRIVQRAILDVCQEKEPQIIGLLGRIPDVLATPTSVGGLKGRGVGSAMALIKEAIANGATWYVRSDIVDFFPSINKAAVRAFMAENVSDADFVALFLSALATELENEDDVTEDLDIFPRGDDGVPQGSALSALCANILLSDFDREMNIRGITTIRYLDDFIVFGPNKKAVDLAWAKAKQLLSCSNFVVHDPTEGTGKASTGQILDGFEFLSLSVKGQSIGPSPKAQKKFLEDIRSVIQTSKANIVKLGSTPRRNDKAFVQSLNLIDTKIRGWGDAFAPTTERLVFAQMDKKLDDILSDYMGWFEKIVKNQPMNSRRRKLGIALLADTNVPRDEDAKARSAGESGSH